MSDIPGLADAARQEAMQESNAPDETGAGGSQMSFHSSRHFPDEIDADTSVRGVLYTITVQSANGIGYELLPASPGADSDKFVKVRPTFGRKRGYLPIVELGAALKDLEFEGYDKLQLARVLSNTKGSVNQFIHAWEEAKWHSDPTKVRENLAQKMTQVEAIEGFTTGNSPAEVLKKTAYRMVAFIREVKSGIGRVDDYAWCGSPAIPEQLLVAAQRQLAAKRPEWQCLPPRP